MQKKRFLQIITGLAIVACSFCLFAKSFLAVHYYPEGGAEVNLMFKLDPFGDNFVGDRDRFEADMQSPLRIYTDEMMVVGEETLKGISKVPLVIYAFCLTSLIAALLKLKKPELKKRWLIIPTIIIPIIIWIIWLFQTYFSEEKNYSMDKQYSYYLSKYNYNKIIERHEYKINLYDEKEQKVLASRHFGYRKMGYLTGRDDCFGFRNEQSEFLFDCSNTYKLPRPIINVKAVEEQVRKREMAISDSIRAIDDSIRWAREEAEGKEIYYERPLISKEEVESIQPVLKKWADFYGVELSKMRTVSVSDFKPFSYELGGLYAEFSDKNDTDTLPDVDYSPDKQRYVDIGGLGYVYGDGEWIAGFDDCQNIYLIDRKIRKLREIMFIGVSGRAETVFWKDNDVFIIVGYDNYPPLSRFVYVFDLKKSTKSEYKFLISENNKGVSEVSGYVEQVLLKEKGFIVDE